MHDPEKSDSAIVAAKPPNKAGPPAAEAVEPRAGGKGKRGSAKHVPDSEAEARAPGAEPRTASRKVQEEEAVHRTSPPCQRRHTADGVLCAQAQSRPWCGRGDMAGLRGGPRAQSRGPPRKGPPGGVSAATVSPDVHTEGGWSATDTGDCRSRR